MNFKYYLKSFIVSFLFGAIIILGVVGMSAVELKNSFGVTNEIMTLNALNDNSVKLESDEELSGIKSVANEYMRIRQIMWIADNPVVRLKRQVLYFVATNVEDFL